MQMEPTNTGERCHARAARGRSTVALRSPRPAAITSLRTRCCELRSPSFGRLERFLLVRFPMVSNVVCKRVIGVGRREQSLNGEQHRAHLQGWAPLVLQDIQANAPKLVNVGVIHLRKKADLWWRHRVLLGQEELEFEDTTCIGGPFRPADDDIEVAKVVRVGSGVDAGCRLGQKPLRLLDDPPWKQRLIRHLPRRPFQA
mmetsp:Transcript_26594/g.67606  ORF Transcript_26594/g.67606 Transcript_26594/m.67606 type:complete len:200 (-) Transcript_26594:41-640(-)